MSTSGGTSRSAIGTSMADSPAPRLVFRSTFRRRTSTRGASSSTSRRCPTVSTSRRRRPVSRTGSASPSRVAATSWRRTVEGLLDDQGHPSTRPSRRTGPMPRPPGIPRVVAAHMYGEHRPYGYAYGGSGGGYRTIGSAENTSGVWDGFVPYVIGSPMAIPNMFTVRMHAQRMLRHRFDQIVDAVEPGGSGDMFEGLTAEERDALTEVTRMGFPPRSWFGHRTMGMHAFPVLYRGLVAADPTYFEDFWTEAGLSRLRGSRFTAARPCHGGLRDRGRHHRARGGRLGACSGDASRPGAGRCGHRVARVARRGADPDRNPAVGRAAHRGPRRRSLRALRRRGRGEDRPAVGRR